MASVTWYMIPMKVNGKVFTARCFFLIETAGWCQVNGSLMLEKYLEVSMQFVLLVLGLLFLLRSYFQSFQVVEGFFQQYICFASVMSLSPIHLHYFNHCNTRHKLRVAGYCSSIAILRCFWMILVMLILVGILFNKSVKEILAQSLT